jgi:hypothetical protein
MKMHPLLEKLILTLVLVNIDESTSTDRLPDKEVSARCYLSARGDRWKTWRKDGIMALQRGVCSVGVDLVCGLGAYVVALWWRYGGASKSLNAGEVIETWGRPPISKPKIQKSKPQEIQRSSKSS